MARECRISLYIFDFVFLWFSVFLLFCFFFYWDCVFLVTVIVESVSIGFDLVDLKIEFSELDSFRMVGIEVVMIEYFIIVLLLFIFI